MLRSLLINSKKRRYHCDRCRVLLDVNMIYSTYNAFHVVILLLCTGQWATRVWRNEIDFDWQILLT